MTSKTEYEFKWSAQRHYIALHDLLLQAGELDIEGLPVATITDMRNKMSYVPANRRFSGWARTTSRQNSFTIVQFDPGLLSEETEQMFGGTEMLPIVQFDERALLETMSKLEAIVSEGHHHSAIYVETLALLAALELGRLQSEGALAEARGGLLSSQQEKLLRDYIENNLAADISLDDLSRVAGLSRFHLTRRFKATFGMPPHKHVTNRRIEMAKQLLKRSSLSVAEVAAATGFSSPGLLIRAFRAATGITPLAYRRR